MEFEENTPCGQIFKSFDDYMYNARLDYKKKGNASMAQCIKIFINSLYGKFGQKHNDLQFYMNNIEFNNDAAYQ